MRRKKMSGAHPVLPVLYDVRVRVPSHVRPSSSSPSGLFLLSLSLSLMLSYIVFSVDVTVVPACVVVLLVSSSQPCISARALCTVLHMHMLK